MRRLLRPVLGAATAALAVLACTTPATPASAADAPYDVLVFSKTAGFRHDSIPVGIQAIRDLGAANNFTVTATEDAAAFTTANLAQYEAVVFLSTTGDVLNATPADRLRVVHRRRRRLRRRARRRRHRVRLAVLRQPGRRVVRLATRRSSRPPSRSRTGRTRPPRTCRRPGPAPTSGTTTSTNPRSNAHVLATLDESSYTGGAMGADHPITWCKTLRRRPVLLHRPRAHPGVVRRAGLPQPPARRHPVRGRPDQGRLPARDRLHRRSTTARPPAGRRPARAASPTPTPR